MRRYRLRIADCGLRIAGDGPAPTNFGAAAGYALLWFVAGGGAAVAIGWFAAKLHASGHAPLGLTSLGVGAAVGVVATSIIAKTSIGSWKALVLFTLVCAAVTIVAEHAWLYREFRRQWSESRLTTPAVAVFRPQEPPPLREFFARDWNPQLWLADAGLIMSAAIGASVAARKWCTHSCTQPVSVDP